MEPWVRPVFYTLLGILILGLVGYALQLRRRLQAESSKWERIAEKKYKEGRNEASQILRAAVDQISDDKVRLAGLSNRELMTEGVLALAGLGRRMDRMEDSIRSIRQFEELAASMNAQAALLRENAELLSQQVTQAQNSAAGLQSAISGSSEAVYSLSDSTHNIESLLEDVACQIRDMGTLSGQFENLQNQLDAVMRRINQTLKVSGENPAAAIGHMDQRLTDMHTQLQNLSEGLNLMAQSLEGVQETLDSVNSRTQTMLQLRGAQESAL